MNKEDNTVTHAETGEGSPPSGGFAADLDTLPKGYYYSVFFLGTMLATGLGLAAAVGGFGLAAPNLVLINDDIGPSPSINWVSIVYLLTLAVGLLLVGRLSDLFGRRYFFIGSAALGLVGCIIAAVAQSVETLIGGTTLIGLAASGQLSFAFITGELVPMKYRFATNATMYFFSIPFTAVGPALSKALILHTTAGWRWCYYIMIIVNFCSGALFTFFYFPPTFHDKYRNGRAMDQLKKLDYVGIFLFSAGLFVFLLGLSWGGQQYPWTSAEVVSTVVLGGVALIAFGFWETYAKLEEPLLPVHLFKNTGWLVSCVLLGLGASIYYAMSVIWPQMVAVLYTDDGGASMYAGWFSCAPGAMINLGQIVAGFLAEPLGKTRYQLIVSVAIGGALLGAMAAATPENRDFATAILIVSCFAIGWCESVTLSLSGIELADQREIGTAVGAAGSIRSTISSVGSAVYLSVLTNRLTQTVPAEVGPAEVGPAEVGPAVVEAGLPESSVPGFLAGLTTGSFDGVDGLSESILAAGQQAYRVANAHAYSTVFYTTIAFSGLAVILSFFAPNVHDKMTGEVAATFHGTQRVEKQVDV